MVEVTAFRSIRVPRSLTRHFRVADRRRLTELPGVAPATLGLALSVYNAKSLPKEAFVLYLAGLGLEPRTFGL